VFEAGALPLKVGVLSLVISVLEAPVSLASLRSTVVLRTWAATGRALAPERTTSRDTSKSSVLNRDNLFGRVLVNLYTKPFHIIVNLLVPWSSAAGYSFVKRLLMLSAADQKSFKYGAVLGKIMALHRWSLQGE
jgi:hypothetical protein